MKGMNFVVFLACSGVGFLLGHFIPDPTWATFTSILVSYHLFLGWLLLTAENDVGLANSIGHTMMAHLAALAVVIGIGMGRHYVPFFGIVRYFIPAMAPFERDWIFSVTKSVKVFGAAVEPATTVDWSNVEPTREDEDAWLQHLSTRHPLSVKSGMTVREEYRQFVLARAKARAAAAATAASTASAAPTSAGLETGTN